MPTVGPVETIQTYQIETTPPQQPVEPTPVLQPTPVTPPATPPAEPEEDKRFAALAQKEKQLYRQFEELKKREAAIQAMEAKNKPWSEAASLAEHNKIEALKKLGISYDDLTNLLLNQGQPTPDIIAAQKAQEVANKAIADFKAEQEKESHNRYAESYQHALKQIREETESVSGKHSDKFPLVNTTKAFDTVVALIEQTFHQTGRIIPVEDAIEQVESYLETQTLELAKLDKIRSKLLPTEDPKPLPGVPTPVSQKPITLTHRTTTAPPAPRTMTAQEKRQRAIDVFHGRIPPSTP